MRRSFDGAEPRPQLSVHKLEVFCSVAKLGSVTRAAAQLGVAQPAVTAHLRDIEEKMRVTLVRRSGRHLELTEAGHRFHRWCQEILTRTSEMARELGSFADGMSGTAVIAASMTVGSYVLGQLIAAFQRQNPDTRVTLSIGNTSSATEAVRTGACDFAVLLLDTAQDLTGLDLEKLWDERLVLIASPGEDRIGTRATLQDLQTLPFVASPNSLLRRDLEDKMLYACGILDRSVVMELGHPEAIKSAVRAGAGFAFIEETAVEGEVRRGDLRVVATPGVILSMPLYLAHRRGKLLTALQCRLMAFIRGAQPRGLTSVRHDGAP